MIASFVKRNRSNWAETPEPKWYGSRCDVLFVISHRWTWQTPELRSILNQFELAEYENLVSPIGSLKLKGRNPARDYEDLKGKGTTEKAKVLL